RPAGLPRVPLHRGGEGYPRPLRLGQGLRREPGAARGQLRSPRPAAVKNFAKAHPHRMGEWSSDSKTSVATMGQDDFASNEQSVVLESEDTLSIVHVAADGTE